MKEIAVAWTPWSPMTIDPRTVRMVEDFIIAVSKNVSKVAIFCVSTCLTRFVVVVVSKRSN